VEEKEKDGKNTRRKKQKEDNNEQLVDVTNF
jgi:hypothetical protein